MFLKTSRYYKQKVVESEAKAVKAITLRQLPAIEGNPVTVQGKHRLDIISQQQYNNPTMFWHIADANSELQANDLVKETGRIIDVPER
jgi:hypothetical protein